MLLTVFSFRGRDYKTSRIPQSYENLQQAAEKIRQLHLQKENEEEKEEKQFRFTYITPAQTMQAPIRCDADLLKAI